MAVNPKPMTDLFILGEILPKDKRAVAVVGSRIMTARGKALTEMFVKELVKADITIVSGLARGIDTVAHETALNAAGRTIAVIGSGLDVIYPPENKNLAEKISKNGAVISPFPEGTPPIGKNFLARNKIIIDLSLAVLVIEGRERSGTISTANYAANLGVEVFAVEGSEATDWLIEQGVSPIQSPQDIIEYINRLDY